MGGGQAVFAIWKLSELGQEFPFSPLDFFEMVGELFYVAMFDNAMSENKQWALLKTRTEPLKKRILRR